MLPSVLGLTQFAHVDLHLCRLSSFLYEVLAMRVTGHFASKSFRPGYFAPYLRTRKIIFEACLFWFMA